MKTNLTIHSIYPSSLIFFCNIPWVSTHVIKLNVADGKVLQFVHLTRLTFNWFKGCTTFWSEMIIWLWGLSRSKHTPTCTYNTVLYYLLTCITEWSNTSRCTPETSSIGNMTSFFLTAVWSGGITVIPIDPKVDTT